MDTLALTDRDGTYGAVRFVRAARRAGIRPVLGVELAVAPMSAPMSAPAGGGARPAHVVRRRGAGRSATCRSSRAAGAGDLPGQRQGGLGRAVPDGLLGPPVRRARSSGRHRRPARARTWPVATCWCCSARRPSWASRRPGAATTSGLAAIAPWLEVVPRENLVVELVSHRLGGRRGDWGPGTSPHAARMAGIARTAGLATVLTNAVRYADRLDAPTIDVLDAARRLVPLGSAHLRDVGPGGSRGNAEGFLKSGKQMHEVAEEVCRLAGLGESERGGPAAARPHPRGRRPVRPRPARRPGHRRGALPGVRAVRRRGRPPPTSRCGSGARRRSAGRYGNGPTDADLEAARRRARDDPRPRLRLLLPHRRRRHRPGRTRWASAAPHAGRAPAAWSTTCSASPGSTRSATGC